MEIFKDHCLDFEKISPLVHIKSAERVTRIRTF